MQNKAWLRDVQIYGSKDVPRSEKCRRVVEHVHGEFCFGSENESWSQALWDRINVLESKAVRRLVGFGRKEDDTLAGCCTRTARAARTIWKKMKLRQLSNTIAESIWSHGMDL